MFAVTVNEQSFSSVAGAKSLLNSLLRSNPYLRTPVGFTLEDEADAAAPDRSVWVSGTRSATALPRRRRLPLLRRGRRFEPSSAPFVRSDPSASNPMPVPFTQSGSESAPGRAPV